MTLGITVPQQTTVYRSSSRIEFRDCKNQTVTLNGDPYLETSAEHSFPTPSGTGGDSISTIRTTGGMRIDTGGVQGRVQFNCTIDRERQPGDRAAPGVHDVDRHHHVRAAARKHARRAAVRTGIACPATSGASHRP